MSRTTMASGAESLKTFAVCRLLFDNIDHVKNFWVMHGLSNAAMSLNFGADDLDGSVVEYKITHDADHYGTPNTMTREDLLAAHPRRRLHPGRAGHPLQHRAPVRRTAVDRRAAGRAAADEGVGLMALWWMRRRETPAPITVGRATAVYTAARFGLFVLFSLLIWSGAGLAGYDVNGFLLLVLGLLASSIAGYFLLAVPRENLAQALAERRPPEA